MNNSAMARQASLIPIERIASRIYLIRGEKVMLDSDLAELYGVETRVLVAGTQAEAHREIAGGLARRPGRRRH